MKLIKNIRFSIKRPTAGRRNFAVVKNVSFIGTIKTEQTHIDDKRLHAINLNMQRELLSVDAALVEIKASLIPALKREAQVTEKAAMESVLSANNRKAFDAFWKHKYEGAELLNMNAPWNALCAALRDIEPLSITSASKSALKDKIGTLPAHRQRNHCIRLNQLLGFLNREFRLEKKRREIRDVHYVTWDELQKILPYIHSEEVRWLAISLWGTGARMGEAFSAGFCRLLPKSAIHIDRQMTRGKTVRSLKNQKPHKTLLTPEANNGYRKWCDVEDKEQFRISCGNQIIVAAKRAFPNKKSKWISAHDLRHSYAVHLLGQGASLTQVAKCLGDTVAVVESYYAGFVMSDAEIDNLARLLKTG